MRFLVLCRAIQPPPVGYVDQLELLEATQERLRSGTDSRIVETMSFAGARTRSSLPAKSGMVRRIRPYRSPGRRHLPGNRVGALAPVS